MRYKDGQCGTRVRLPDGRTGKIISYPASFGLSFFGGGFKQRRVNTAREKAEVKIDKTGERVRVPISKLKKLA